MSSVDVIVPCYRYARFLRQCVRSVLDQADVSVRVLILDDASPDETPDVARRLVDEDSRVSYVRHTDNMGHINTYNEGIAWTASKYYLLLSADDYLLPGALGRSVSTMDQNPSVGFVFGNAIQCDQHGVFSPVKPFAQKGAPKGSCVMSGADFIKASGACNIVPTPTAVIRTELQKSSGGYKADLPHAGDMEMWFRLAARGDVGFVDSGQAVYRRHGTNMSSAYMEDCWLPDIQQRREALEHFFRESSGLLAELDGIKGDALESLSAETIGLASTAYNKGQPQLSEQLAELAADMNPGVKLSWKWRNLAIKKMIGPRIWRSLQNTRTLPQTLISKAIHKRQN